LIGKSPVQLTRHRKPIVDEDNLPDRIRKKPGVYFFSRKFGSKFEPFYIGETLTVRNRLKGHLNSKKIAFVLFDIDPDSPVKGGVRYFHFGYLKSGKGSIAKKRLKNRSTIPYSRRHREWSKVDQQEPRYRCYTLTDACREQESSCNLRKIRQSRD